MPRNRAEGGYGEVRHVRIAKMAGIPTDCDFATKKSKAATPLLQRQAQSMEACVNPIQHPGMIKFWVVHHKTMESYTLWWNGGSLASFLHKLNSKVSEATTLENIKYSRGELLPDELDKVTLYRRNCAKLALSLLIIVEKCHAHGIQHNNLVTYGYIFHPWTRQRFSWVFVIGGWHAALARRLHQITVIEVKRKWKCNKDYASMLHRSYFTFLDHVDLRHLWSAKRKSTCIPRAVTHMRLGSWPP